VFPGGQDMQQLLMQAQKMQQDLLAAQEELAQAQVEGSAGGGLVTARVSGSGELTGLRIDPQAIDPGDAEDTAETLADLVLAAVRDANRAAAELQQNKLGPLTQGMGGGIGGGIGGLGGTGGGLGLPGM
jgi:DNA-binding YbaB/EbfC family protein